MSLPADERAIIPSVGLELGFDSNVYDTNTSRLDSWKGTITPTILINSSPARHRIALLYEGDYGFYSLDSADNYADHSLGVMAKLQPGSRLQLDLTASTAKEHRERGSDQTDGIEPDSPEFPSEPDEFTRHRWGGQLRYGADGNRGQLRFGVGGSEREYTTNLQRTRFRDFATVTASAGMSLYFNERTAVVFDAVFTDISYERPLPGEAILDSEDWRYLLGLSWQATARTAGSVRVGLQQRRFDAPVRGNTSNPSWEARVRWSPRDHSHFEFSTSRVNEETFAEGSFIDTSAYRVAWTHEWIGNWQSIISWSLSDSEFVDSLRNQDYSETSLSLRYPQNRLVTWQAGYSRRSRDSSLSNLVFDGDLFSIGVSLGD